MVTHDPKAADHATRQLEMDKGQPGRTRGRRSMKYLPLVWAAILRKPARAILTLLSIVMAFTLFGLTIGLNATFRLDRGGVPGHDRIYVNPRKLR